MKIALHGTSQLSAINIMENGYKPKHTNWKPSDIKYCYGVDYEELDEDCKAYSFTRVILQGISACLIQDVDIIPSFIIINIENKDFTPDLTGTFPEAFAPIQISNVMSEDVMGVYSIDRDLNMFKALMIKMIEDGDKPTQKINITPEMREFVDCLESYKLYQNSIKRKIVEIKNFGGVKIPTEVII